MLRISPELPSLARFAAAIGFPLFLAGCGDEATPPSAPRIEAASRPAARVSALAADRARFDIRDRAANATFASIDPSGCVETVVFVFGAQETVKVGPGKPSTGPVGFLQLSEVDFCTGQVRELFGFADDATFQVSTKLDEARLRATIPGFDVVDGVEVPAVVDLTWTGSGELITESNRYRLKLPGAMVTQWFRGTFRPAQVSGTVLVGDENLATDPVDALILRARQGSFEMVRTR
jgi:hypothetical protein